MTSPEGPPPRPRPPLKTTPPDTAAQLIADIINQKVEAVQEQEAAKRDAATRQRRRGRAWYFLVALPVLVGLTVWNLVRAAHPPPVFTASERESAVRFRIYLAAQAVEAYHDSLGQWPADLTVVGFGDAGFVYKTGTPDYAITDTSSVVPLSYRRGDMFQPFAGAYNELKGRGAR